jgi:membrane associated rhomboid family serine protease
LTARFSRLHCSFFGSALSDPVLLRYVDAARVVPDGDAGGIAVAGPPRVVRARRPSGSVGRADDNHERRRADGGPISAASDPARGRRKAFSKAQIVMGIYDRPYYREDDSGGLLGGRTMVVNIILFTVGCYVAQLLFPGIENWLALSSGVITHPWRLGQLLTYGFMHDRNNIFHVAFNMLFLWFCGREIEAIYGPREFLRVYLTLIVMSGLVWAVSVLPNPQSLPLVGASGGVTGIMMLYTLHFPRRLIYIWGVLPVPVWAMMAFFLIGDFMDTAKRLPGDYVAHIAHLAGALFGFIYFRSGWNLGHFVPERWTEILKRPRLKLHDPEPEEPDLSRQVDQILEKIHRQGEASLTKKERQTLEEASRRYQRRRQ